MHALQVGVLDDHPYLGPPLTTTPHVFFLFGVGYILTKLTYCEFSNSNLKQDTLPNNIYQLN